MPNSRHILDRLSYWRAGRGIGGFLILLTAAVAAIGVLQWQTNRLTSRLGVSNLALCHRLNLIRASDNSSHYIEWSVLGRYAVAPRLRAQLTWIPLTGSCQFAVDHVKTFTTPEPVYFSTALPTAKDFRVGPGE